MVSIKEEAQAYEPMQTKNIADLEKVPTDLELHTEVAKQGTPDEFSYKYVVVDGERYRVPGVVIGDLKAIIEKKPDLKFFSVIRKGTGMSTRYTVMPE